MRRTIVHLLDPKGSDPREISTLLPPSPVTPTFSEQYLHRKMSRLLGFLVKSGLCGRAVGLKFHSDHLME